MLKKINKNIINIAKTIAPVVSSRDLIMNLKKEISQCLDNEIQLDFSQVEFVSRSAAHSLLTLKEDLQRQTNKKEIAFINTNEEISKMLRLVAANRALPQKNMPEFQAKTVDIKSLLTV